MFPKPWQNWLVIVLAILLIGAGGAYVLAQQHYISAANYLLWGSQIVASLWTLFYQWKHRSIRWVKWSGVLLLGTLFVLALSGFYVAWIQFDLAALRGDFATSQPKEVLSTRFMLLARDTWSIPRVWSIGITGVWLLGIAFFAGLWFVRLLLRGSHPVIGVARTLVDEAIRMKVVLVLVVLVMLIVALLPLILNFNERLEYRVQTFISISTTAVWLLLALMTVFLGCISICGEIANKQIYMTMTKALGKFEYLLGKWIGICLINFWLILVAGVGIYMSTQILAVQPARDVTDYNAVHDHILSARLGVTPVPSEGSSIMSVALERFKELRQTDPKFAVAQIDVGDPVQLQQAFTQLPTKLRDEIQNYAIARWQSIKPREGAVFWFRGVGKAKEFEHSNVQLRLKPKASPVPPDERIKLMLFVNGQLYPKPVIIAQNTVYTVDIPLQMVDRNGDVELRIANVNPMNPEATDDSTVNFPPGQGIEMVYPAGTFEGNLFRAMVMIYAQLVFLGMLALASGTFLGFPVACLLSLMVLVIAVCAGFLSESLESYAAVPIADLSLWQRGVIVVKGIFDKIISGEFWDATKLLIRLFGQGALIINPNLAAHSPIDQITDGKLISNSQVWSCLFRVGVCSTFVTGLIGWLIWRKREIARVIV